MGHARTTERRTRPGSGIASRYRALLLTHGSLEEKLAEELKRPVPDFAAVQRLKRRKLAIKDELASIDHLLDAIGATDERAAPGLDRAGWPIVTAETGLHGLVGSRPARDLAAARSGADLPG